MVPFTYWWHTTGGLRSSHRTKGRRISSDPPVRDRSELFKERLACRKPTTELPIAVQKGIGVHVPHYRSGQFRRSELRSSTDVIDASLVKRCRLHNSMFLAIKRNRLHIKLPRKAGFTPLSCPGAPKEKAPVLYDGTKRQNSPDKTTRLQRTRSHGPILWGQKPVVWGVWVGGVRWCLKRTTSDCNRIAWPWDFGGQDSNAQRRRLDTHWAGLLVDVEATGSQAGQISRPLRS